ncbi:exfoliative toxin A/B [Orenia metallireducens]|uniref:Exfoliative toxin A/B n=1 Tax=Orenia metallireducens TaxID=1413210 RepID=A0A285GGB7_9FIRM|nr:TDT family transporter [Orenia metallireducens]PRX30430.1 exfoliative toxin A/B [Orenia metallireducens]SNY22495.1 exfoliative toxin A/B [Orenia metallireducens]
MTEIFKRVPVPIAGLMLGLAGLGNLIQGYGNQYRYLAGILAMLVALLLIGSFFANKKGFLAQLENPVVASVFPTFSMAIIILATYLLPFSYQLALYFWYGGIVLHILLMILFSISFIFNFNIKKVFPSCFIVYVGIVVASVTAPAFNQLQLGQIIFWFGFATYLLLLPIITYRVLVIKEIKKAALPTISIFTAPAGLCLAGYMSAFTNKSLMMVGLLSLLTLVMITLVTSYLPKMISRDFYPSFSAFTFPFVITAIGLKMASSFLQKNFNSLLLYYPARGVELLSIALVSFVLFKYLVHIVSVKKLRELSTQKS